MRDTARDPSPAFNAIVLAGERGAHDPLTAQSGAPCKALVPVGGTPMILRVLEALGRSREIGPILLSGPAEAQLERAPQLREGIVAGHWGWCPPEASPSASAYAALRTLPPGVPVLVTTADHALLRPEVVDHFCVAARRSDSDLAVALVGHDRVLAAFPDAARTRLRFRGGAYCGCNLYAFLTPVSRAAAAFWREVEQDRKRPWRMIRKLGWLPLLAYLSGSLSLDDSFGLVSKRLRLVIRPVLLPFPEAAVDVDKPSDLALAERILREGLDRLDP